MVTKFLAILAILFVLLTIDQHQFIVADDDLIVVDTGGASPEIIRVDVKTGAQSVISSGNLMESPREILTLATGELYVVDTDAFGGNGGVIEIDRCTGIQTEISSGGLFDDPVSLVMDAAGMLVVVDRQAEDGTGAVIRVDPETGDQTLVASGGLDCPHGVAIGPQGDYFVTSVVCNGTDPDDGKILRIDPQSGTFDVIAIGSGLTTPAGIVYDTTRNKLFVANANQFGTGAAILRVDPDTGVVDLVTSNGLLDPIDLALDADGQLLVTDLIDGGTIFSINPADGSKVVVSNADHFEFPIGIEVAPNLVAVDDLIVVDTGGVSPEVIRVSTQTGDQTVISAGNLMESPREILMTKSGEIYLADSDAFGGNGGIIQLDPWCGSQTEVSSGGLFDDPVSLVMDAAGMLVVVDRQAVDGTGAVIRVDPETGDQTLVASGGLDCPHGVAIGPQGDYFVTSVVCNGTDPDDGKILRIDPQSGTFDVIAIGSGLTTPAGIVYDTTRNKLFVANANQFGTGAAILRVDPDTGVVDLVTSNGLLDPIDLALDADGQLLVTDLIDGGTIFSINPADGSKVVVSNADHFEFPIGIDIVTDPVTCTCADGGTLVEGSGEAGDFTATCGSDDIYWAAHGLSFAYQISDPVSQFELVTIAPAEFADGNLMIAVEASKESDGGTLNIRALLFNFETERFEALPGILPLAVFDTSRQFTLPAEFDSADFVDPENQEVRLLIQTIQSNGAANVRTQLDDVLFLFE